MTKMADYIAGPIQTTELAKQAFYTVRHNKQLVGVQVVGILIAIVIGIATLLVVASSIFLYRYYSLWWLGGCYW